MKIKELLKNKIKFFSLCVLLAVIVIVLLQKYVFSSGNSEYRLNNERYDEEVKELLFDIGCQAISGEACFDKNIQYPYSEGLKIILSHSFITDGCIINLLDKYFPLYSGIADSSGFYNPSEDKGEWIEETIIRAEEERIALEISELEKSLEELQEDSKTDSMSEQIPEDIQAQEDKAEGAEEESDEASDSKESVSEENQFVSERLISHNADEIEAVLKKEFSGKILSDKNSKLKILEDEGEILIPMESSQGYSVIQANGSSVTRRFYNEKLRITKKEIWTIDSIDVDKPDSSEEYSYEADGESISSKLIDSGSDFTLINYDVNGLIADLHRYLILDEKKYTLQKRKCTYDDDKNIISDENIDYVYTDDTYKKIKYIFSKKYVYEYNEGDIPPDYKYYENGIMKMHNKYSLEKGNYTSQIYFEDNLSVKAYYENNIHVRDVYYRAGNIIREKVYEESEQTE